MATEADRPTPVSMPEPDTHDDRDVIDQALVDELLEQAGDRGLLGDGGPLTQLAKQVLETALDVELTEHLATNEVTSTVAGRGTRAMAPPQDGPHRHRHGGFGRAA